MPPGKSSDNRGVMAALIVFVVLFIIAATAAVILYTKFEDQRAIADKATEARNEIVTSSQYSQISKTFGKPVKGQTYSQTMLEYLNELCQLINGNISESSASMKIENIKRQVNELNAELGSDATAVFGKDGVDLLQTIKDLKTKLDLQRETAAHLQTQTDQLQEDFETVVNEAMKKEQSLNDLVNHYQQKAEEIQESYDEIRQIMEKSADEQVQIYIGRLDNTKETLQEKSVELETTRQQLEQTTEELQVALAQIEAIKPQPDTDVAAFDMDAKVTSIDIETGLIYLNIGSDDHVYVGLTFAIFDKSNPKPKDGLGKAEIEVFQVGKKVSAARIIESDKKRPISEEDLAVNLIWDSETSNKFVVIGDFDFDNDGTTDHDGREKVIQLIERWGGTVADEVTINTDFVVLGSAPVVPLKPTMEQIEYDPTVEAKYNRAVLQTEKYMSIVENADRLSIPKFSRTRFFNLIGYNTTAERATPF